MAVFVGRCVRNATCDRSIRAKVAPHRFAMWVSIENRLSDDLFKFLRKGVALNRFANYVLSNSVVRFFF